MNRDQRIVAIGAGSGVATMVLSVAVLYSVMPVSSTVADVGGRLAYACRAHAFAALPLLAGVIAVGNSRFLSEAIDPTLHRESREMEVNGRVVENTLQQFVLFVVATLAVAAGVDARQMRIIPAAAAVFVVARVAFWVGYRIHPLYRAFGMAATMYLNLGLLGWALWLAAA